MSGQGQIGRKDKKKENAVGPVADSNSNGVGESLQSALSPSKSPIMPIQILQNPATTERSVASAGMKPSSNKSNQSAVPNSASKGASGNKSGGVFKGGQKLAVSLSRKPNATQIFDTFVRDILLKGGYLNSDDIVAGLRDKIDELHHLSAFKTIQGTNRVVHSAVLCYWQSRSIRIYAELEEFVIKQVAGYRQLRDEEIPKKFEELGLGNLIFHDTVNKKFEFYELRSKDDLPRISTREILLCMQEFTVKNMFARRPDDKLESAFREHLRRIFKSPITGVDIDFKSLFLNTSRSRSAWFSELKTVKDKFTNDMKQGVTSALTNLVNKPSSKSANRLMHDLRSAGVNPVTLRQSLKSMNVVGTDAFLSSIHAISLPCPSKSSNGLRMRVLERLNIKLKTTTTPDISMFENVDEALPHVRLKQKPTPASLKMIISCVVGLVVHLFHQRSNSLLQLSETPGMHINVEEQKADEKSVVNWLDEHLVQDIPALCLEDCNKLLLSLIQEESIFNISNSLETASINWGSIEQAVEAIFDRNNMELKIMRIEVYRGLLTVVILFCRVLDVVICQDENVVSGKVNCSLNSLTASVACRLVSLVGKSTSTSTFSELAVTADQCGPLTAFLLALQLVEMKVNEELSIPCFECARTGGSFLQFIIHQVRRQKEERSSCITESGVETIITMQHALETIFDSLLPGIFEQEPTIDHVKHGHVSGDFVAAFDDGLKNITTEEALKDIQIKLMAALSAAELRALGNHSMFSLENLLNFFTQLLREVETAVADPSSEFGIAIRTAQLPSYLELVCNVLDSDEELCSRIKRLISCENGSGVNNPECRDSISVAAERVLSSSVTVLALVSYFSHPQFSTETFSSELALEERAAQVLGHSLAIPFVSAKLLAARGIKELSAEGYISVLPSAGALQINIKEADHNTILAFQCPSSCALEERDALVTPYTMSNELRDALVQNISATRLGESCCEATLWNECSYADYLRSSIDDNSGFLSILEFIVTEKVVLQQLRPGIRYYVIPGTLDCFPIPEMPTAQERKNLIEDQFICAWRNHDYKTIAAWCLSAVIGLSEKQDIEGWLGSVALQSYEVFGTDAVPRLCDQLMSIAFALPNPASSLSARNRCGHHAQVLSMCLKVLAVAARFNEITAQQCALEFAQSSAGMVHLRPLLAACRSDYGKELLPTLWAQFKAPLSIPHVLLRVPDADALGAADCVALKNNSSSMSEKATNHHNEKDSFPLAHKSLTDAPSTLFNSTGSSLGIFNSNKQAVIFKLLETDFHYSNGGHTRPPSESSEARKLQQALKLLSASLYSSQVHFVMELIQNADDNQYAASVIPTLRLELFPHAVVVYNNEVGFSNDNIVAICNVNGSTKANKCGYIGQKGIGFKSVFSVSDCPEIHSNGFHIKFDKTVSMLEPIWIEETSDTSWPEQYQDGTYFETCLRLTLDEAAKKNRFKLNQDIQDAFNGKLILFLNRLERMILENREKQSSVTFHRFKITDNWLRVVSTKTTTESVAESTLDKSTSETFWLVYRCPFKPAVRRMEVMPDMTEVSITFKLSATGRSVRASSLLTSQRKAFNDQKETENHEFGEALEEILYNNEYLAQNKVKLNSKTDEHRTNLEELALIEEIRLDFSESPLPIYAYLPTGMACFPFILQGDFVLPTNRESILEHNDWNIGLFSKVPKIFAEAIAEMSAWSTLPREPTVRIKHLTLDKFPILGQIAADASYSLIIDTSDLLRVIPRRISTQLESNVNKVISDIYRELQCVSFLKAQSDILCTPQQLCTVHHLRHSDLNPVNFLSEELLYEATGLRYAFHSPGEYELDDLAGTDALNIPKFGVEHVLKCLEHLSKQSHLLNTTAPEVKDDLLHQIVGSLLLLDQLCRHNQLSALHRNTKKNLPKMLPISSKVHPSWGSKTGGIKGAIPRQVLLSTNEHNESGKRGGLTGHLNEDCRAILRSLCIWDIENGVMSTLEKETVFVSGWKSSSSIASFSPEQQYCFEKFSHRIRRLSSEFVNCATAFVPQFGKETLLEFLVENLRPKTRSAAFSSATTKRTGMLTENTGGIEELTADIVLRRVIFPAYQTFAEKQFHRNDPQIESIGPENTVDDHLDRVTAAAFLAFLFNSKWSLKLNDATNPEFANLVRDVGVVVPVLSARDSSTKGHIWDSPSLVLLRCFESAQLFSETRSRTASNVVNELHTSSRVIEHSVLPLPASEIHIGLELRNSATSILSTTQTVTAFRQLGWKIVDPIVAALACGTQTNLPLYLDNPKPQYKGSDVEEAFRSTASVGVLKNKQWFEFLLRIGVVNFFGVYNLQTQLHRTDMSPSNNFDAPYLFEYITHLTRNGRDVYTSRLLSQHTGADLTCSSGVEKEFLPIFMPSKPYDANTPTLKSVTKEVHDTMVVVLPMVISELKRLSSQRKNFDGIYQKLNSERWCPCHIDRIISAVEPPLDPPLQQSPPKEEYWLASSGDIFKRNEIQIRCDQTILFQPHCTVLVRQLETNCDIIDDSTFHFASCDSRSFPDPQIVLRYFKWLSGLGEKVVVHSSVNIMSELFQALKSIVLQSKNGPGSQCWATQEFGRLIQNDAPFMWIPSELPEVTDGVDQSLSQCRYVNGKLISLSKLIKSDPSFQFVSPDSPIKCLSLYYSASASDVVNMFCRKIYCFTCQAAEGMFGLFGGVEIATDRISHICDCRQDKFCSEITVKYGRSIRKSPSAEDLVTLLAQHCEQLALMISRMQDQSACSGKGYITSRFDESVLDEKINASKEAISNILTALSMNIWKCFQIKRSLHPYSSDQLSKIHYKFASSALLPTLDYKSFVPAGSACSFHCNDPTILPKPIEGVVPICKRQVAVDDIAAFTLFSTELQPLSAEVDWLEVMSLDSSLITSSTANSSLSGADMESLSLEEGNAAKYSFDIVDLQADEAVLLHATPREFNEIVRTISPETFFAPPNKLALYSFLQVSKLSDYITEEWIVQHRKVNQPQLVARKFVGVMNNLLTYAHAFYFHGGSKSAKRNESLGDLVVYNLSEKLCQATRLRTLFEMDIVECDTLHRRLHLSLYGVSGEKLQEENYQRRVVPNKENILQLSATISDANIQKLAVALLLRALKIELALIEVRQEPVEMKELENRLEKVSRYKNESQLENLLETDEISEIPNDCHVWKLRATNLILEDTQKPAVIDEASFEAIRAYEILQADARERASAHNVSGANKKVNAELQSKIAVEEKFVKHKLEQQLRMKEAGEHAVRTANQEETKCLESISVEDSLRRDLNRDEEDKLVRLLPEERIQVGATPAIITGFPLETHSIPVEGEPFKGSGDVIILQNSTVDYHCSGGENNGTKSSDVDAGGNAHEGNRIMLNDSQPPFSLNVVNGCGEGRYHPLLNANNQTGTLCPDVFNCQELLGKLDLHDSDRELLSALMVEEESESYTNIRENAISGRYGEFLAVKYLERAFVSSGIFKDVSWVNEITEAGKPYDIEVTFRMPTTAGSKMEFADEKKYCEVKTRSVRNKEELSMFVNKQWAISPAEIKFAMDHHKQYFGVFVNVLLDYKASRPPLVEGYQVWVVGLENGLIQAISADRTANLFLQINHVAKVP